MKSSIVGVVALSLAGTLAVAGAAFAGSSGAAQVGAAYVAGPQRVTDPVNHTVIEVPKGWFAAVPLRGVAGVTTLTNYDAGRAESLLGLKSNHVVLKDMAKVDVLTLDLGNAISLREWMSQRYAGNGDTEDAVATSRKMALQIAGKRGLATVVHLGLASSVEIALPFGKNKVLLANIAPVDTVDLEGALAAVDRVRGSVDTGKSQLLTKAALSRLTASLHNLIDGEILQAGSLDKMQNVTGQATVCSSWTGSDSGDCSSGMSCASTAGITLYLPFQYATYWTAGGAGSFYGNNAHGNCNLDYYAIDYNQYSSSNCASGTAVNEIGQNVYAAASGTANKGTYSSTGYGYNVIVTHSNGYKTRYAHLSSISITNGQAVTGDVTVVGLAGDSGSAAGSPHVHLSYMNGSNQSYCNKSGGCPNGEAAKSPQTKRPSPMVTNLGTLDMLDGHCYMGPS